MKQYDIVVLGAGPGGYVAAIRAAQLGANVAIVEKEYFGGVCLNIGCIPTKAMVRDAEILHLAQRADKHGILLDVKGVDMAKVQAGKAAVVNQMVNGVKGLLAANGVDVYQNTGTCTDKNTIVMDDADKTEIEYKKLVVATGSSPLVPPIPGFDTIDLMTSTELLSIQEVPEHLIIVGGGVIGCEFAGVFNAFGSKVTIVEMMPSLLPTLDAELGSTLQRSFKMAKIDTMVGCKVESAEKTAAGVKITVSKDGETQQVEGSHILVSIGRKANTAGLEALNLDSERGYIKVDAQLKTSNPDVYAIGDITAKIQLAHVASAMGMCAVENILTDKPRDMDLSVVPSCVYTIPEIGSVGLTEQQAKDQYGEILVGKFPLMASGKATAMGEGVGSFKVIADKKTHKVLGAHLIGANATELIAEVAAYMHMGGTLDDITGTIHAHPTISESIMEAAEAAEGRCIHMPPAPKR